MFRQDVTVGFLRVGDATFAGEIAGASDRALARCVGKQLV